MVCSVCKKNIEYDKLKNILICEYCNFKYNIRNGVPVMLVDKAKNINRVAYLMMLKNFIKSIINVFFVLNIARVARATKAAIDSVLGQIRREKFRDES